MSAAAAADSYCGYRLTGVGRKLPDEVRCGVCKLTWKAAASPEVCPHCRCDRIAAWQRLESGEIIAPGAILVPRDATVDMIAIVTSVERVKKRISVVAFEGVAHPEPLELGLDDVVQLHVVSDDPRAARFSEYALCPSCEQVFRLENWDLDLDGREEIAERRRAIAADLERAIEEKARLKQNNKVSKTPKTAAAILRVTADIKRWDADSRALARRLRAPQHWCPRCLCRDFPLLLS